jgi:HlyD family secretion protein
MSMDKVIEKQKMPAWQWALIGLVVLVAGWFAYNFWSDASIRTYSVNRQQVIISTVAFADFEDVIPIRGTVQPLNTVFLDAVDGGVIEEIFVEEGSFVELGQPLLQFSNTDLQLSVASNDTNITEQLNNLSNISNSLETTQITTNREIIDTEYRIVTLQRLKARQQTLVEDDLISRDLYEATLDELDYQHKVLENILARQELENNIREERQIQIQTQIRKLEENLAVSQNSFENLLVRAPISGQLTSFPIEVGENKTQGQRLGQIDVENQYKIVAQIDEFYVTRISTGQEAQFSISGSNYTARVDKIYPEITGGTFEVDLIFGSDVPTAIRRGQTLQMNLTLSNSSQSLILPIGGFVQDTGGTWVFVLDENGEYASRREIRLGRRNNRFLEIQGGLQEGENVITSSYNQMIDMERIQLQ